MTGNIPRMVENLRKNRGEDWILRLVQGIVLYRRTTLQLSADLGIAQGNLSSIRATLFERVRVKGEVLYVARGAAREQLNAIEEYRRKRFEEVLDMENWVLATIRDPDRLRLYADQIVVRDTPGVSRQLNELRERMGAERFRGFLHAVRSQASIFDVERRFKKFGIRFYTVQLLRKSITRPTRALVDDLAKIAGGALELVGTKKQRPVKAALHLLPAGKKVGAVV